MFAGMRPIVSPNNLPSQNASYCRDCYLESTGIDPIKSALSVGSGYAGAKSLYKAGSKFIQMTNYTNFARSPIIKDKFERIYFTQDTGGLQVTTWNDLADNVTGKRLSEFKAPSGIFNVVVSRPADMLTSVEFSVVYLDTTGTPTFRRTQNKSVSCVPGLDTVQMINSGLYKGFDSYLMVVEDGKYYRQSHDGDDNNLGVERAPFIIDYDNPVTGVPALGAIAAPDFKVSNGSDNVKETTLVVTNVSIRDEESAPSAATRVIEYEDGVDGLLIGITPTTDPDIAFRRVYMERQREFFCLQDKILPGQAILTVSPLDDDLNKRRQAAVAAGDAESLIGSGLVTSIYFPPPDDLQGLIELPNGCLAGFTLDDTTGGKVTATVHVSEPYAPHAWPIEYRWKVNYKIVALGKVSEGFLALVEGQHSIITGRTPDVMTEEVLETQQSCKSRESVQEIGGSLVWDSPDGITTFGGGQIRVLTTEIWSREQWQALNANQIRLGQYEGRLLVYPFGSSLGYLVDLRRSDVVELSQGGVTALYYDVEQDELYIVRAGQLQKFNQGAAMTTAQWVSKPIKTNGKPFKAAKLEIEGAVRMSLYKGDNNTNSADQLVNVFNHFWQKIKATMKPFRVGSSQRKRSVVVGFELTGGKRLREFQLERDMRVLR